MLFKSVGLSSHEQSVPPCMNKHVNKHVNNHVQAGQLKTTMFKPVNRQNQAVRFYKCRDRHIYFSTVVGSIPSWKASKFSVDPTCNWSQKPTQYSISLHLKFTSYLI